MEFLNLNEVFTSDTQREEERTVIVTLNWNPSFGHIQKLCDVFYNQFDTSLALVPGINEHWFFLLDDKPVTIHTLKEMESFVRGWFLATLRQEVV